MVWRREDPQGNEAGKIRWELVKWTRGRGLDVGCGGAKPFGHFIGVDNGKDVLLFGHQFKPDVYVDDAGKLDVFATASMEFVFSSHLLEHIEPERVGAVLGEWWRVLKDGGYLILYLPDETLYPKLGEPGANPDHKWNVSYRRVIDYMKEVGSWDLLDWQRRDQDNEYSLFFVFEKAGKGHRFSCADRPSPRQKKAAVVRYGAFGDILQASSVLAGLKKQGYHTTLYCSRPGADVIQDDPNVDEFYLQEQNQVPNPELVSFWDYHKKKYDKWVQMSESVEGTLLTIPSRPTHMISPAARHKLMNVNYLEFQHLMAGVPHEPAVRFYPNERESKWAAEMRARSPPICIVWAQAGSSVHKKWPWMDLVIGRMLVMHQDVGFVLVGGPDCVLLEQGWFRIENGEPVRVDGKRIMADPRVLCTSGDWHIRETMAFTQQADIVIGPETGLVNGMALEPMPKIVFLSHSTVENLTRDWVNTHSIVSAVTHCPGRGANEAPACHQLHYNWDFCKEVMHDDGTRTGIAQCMMDIPGDLVFTALQHCIDAVRAKRKAAA